VERIVNGSPGNADRRQTDRDPEFLRPPLRREHRIEHSSGPHSFDPVGVTILSPVRFPKCIAEATC
jgi:hypothetical protein